MIGQSVFGSEEKDTMTTCVISRDGTPIAFDSLGQGPPVVVVSGMFCDRSTTKELAGLLGKHFTVINYDRRGRGGSGDTTPYAVEREVEDLAALIDGSGGEAAVYGHSSGAGLAIRAAASGLPISRLVLHEPPYGPDDEQSQDTARALAENVRVALNEDRPADAIRLFFADSGMPPESVEAMSADPKMVALAPTMDHDLEVMGDFGGGTVPEDVVRDIAIPTLVVAGGASPDFFRETADQVTRLLPNAGQVVLEGQDHGASAEVVAPVVTAFLQGV